MKIIILGAGQVGSSAAESLVSEANDITVVDTDAACLAALQENLDLRTVAGNAANPSPLREYRAPLAASNSGVSVGRPAWRDASLGQIAT